MGTDHLKARCICPRYEGDGDPGTNPGCPIHTKPTPIDTEKAAEIGKRLADRAIQYAGKFIPTDAQVAAKAQAWQPTMHARCEQLEKYAASSP